MTRPAQIMKNSLVLLLVVSSAATLAFPQDEQPVDQEVAAFENAVHKALTTLNEAFGQQTQADQEKRSVSKRGWLLVPHGALDKRNSEDGVTEEELQEVQEAINTLKVATGIAALDVYGADALKFAEE